VTGGAPVVLVVADDAKMRRLVSVALAGSDYGVLEAPSTAQGVELASRHRPDIVVLDLGSPDPDGSEVIRRLRRLSQLPILVISETSDEEQRKKALEEGATEYFAKPFEMAELLSRIRAVLRKRPQPDEDRDHVVDLGGEIQIDLPARSVIVRGRHVHLTPTEFKLLAALVESLGSVATYRSLLAAVWGPGHTQQVQSLRVHVNQLRQKLERAPSRPKYLLTETGVGYRLKA
jgi:two-component system KDP operon response regulator KdpE